MVLVPSEGHFSFQSERPPSRFDQVQSSCPIDVCFLYSDTENRGSISVRSSPDDRTVNQIRTYLEDRKVRCSIARPPNDAMGKSVYVSKQIVGFSLNTTSVSFFFKLKCKFLTDRAIM